MNKKEHLLLAEFLDELREAEHSQNNIKHHLPSFNASNFAALFKQIAFGSPTISPSMLAAYLQPKIKLTDDDLYTVFGKFDYDLEGQISNANFGKELQPRGKKPRGQVGVSYSIEEGFLQLVKQYLDSERVLAVCRKDLQNLVMYDAFDVIATEQKGYISVNEVGVFMSANGLRMEREQLELVLHGLKRRSYYKVTLESFCENMNPHEFGRYKEFREAVERDEQEVHNRKSKEEEDRAREIKEHEQKVEGEARRKRRRQQADLSRQKQLELTLKRESEKAREESEKLLRRAELEAQKLQRLDAEQQSLIYRQELQHAQQERHRIQQLMTLNARQAADADHFNNTILNNQLELQEVRRQLREDQIRLYQQEVRNQIEADGIKNRLRRDRCLSNTYSHRTQGLNVDAEIERIRRQTATGLSGRDPVYPRFSHREPELPLSNQASTGRERVVSMRNSLMGEVVHKSLRTPTQSMSGQLGWSQHNVEAKGKRSEYQMETTAAKRFQEA